MPRSIGQFTGRLRLICNQFDEIVQFAVDFETIGLTQGETHGNEISR